jgi:ubiquinone/menaquinone biosynthesis C-methylase UbiE
MINAVLSKICLLPGHKAADFGCGARGSFVFPMSSAVGENGKVYAVDILEKALESVSRKAVIENVGNIETLRADLEIFGSLKLESGFLDRVIIANTLFQMKYPLAALREGARILRRKGLLIVVERSPEGYLGQGRDGMQIPQDWTVSVAEKNGLKCIECFEPGVGYYGALLERA